MALLDPFLHTWDERYHALVAKNMIKYPFKPMLFLNPHGNYNKFLWSENHIWLHKQPLFLWQMALSMKLFGVSEFTMRLPSVIMGTLSIFLLYRIAILATNNKTIASIASLFLCFSHYQLVQISGRLGMDHNDIAFGFYVLASIWAFFEYYNSSRKTKWIILIGLFAGCAVLCKWLTGLVVFSFWGVFCIFSLVQKKNFTELKKMLLSFLVSLIVFVPWQIFILIRYTELAKYEYAFNTKHIFEVVENHAGGLDFYLKNLNGVYGLNIWILVFVGILISFLFKTHNKILLGASVFYFLLVYLFFSLLVKTKIESYVFIVIPLGLMFAAIAFYRFFHFLKLNDKIVVFLSLPICFLCLNFSEISFETEHNPQRPNLIHNTHIYKSLAAILPKNIHEVNNVVSPQHIDCMFYNNDLSAWHYWINEDTIKLFEKKKIWIATFKNHEQNNNPPFILNYPYLYVIPNELK